MTAMKMSGKRIRLNGSVLVVNTTVGSHEA